jgi:hypothetical protein
MEVSSEGGIIIPHDSRFAKEDREINWRESCAAFELYRRIDVTKMGAE